MYSRRQISLHLRSGFGGKANKKTLPEGYT